VAGANSSTWRSSLVAYNSSQRPLAMRLTLHRAGGNTRIATALLSPGESRRWKDVVGELFDEANVVGALTIEVSSSEIILQSATSNRITDGGMISQAVPLVRWADLFRSGQTARLVGIDRSEDSRTNVALLNLGRTATLIRASVHDEKGKLLGERDYVLEPGDINQRIDLFDALDIKGLGNLTVTFRCLTDDGTFYVYASTVDQRTGAPLFQAAQ